MNNKRLEIFMIAPVLEYPPHGGSWLRVFNSIKALRQVADLTVYSRVSQKRIGGAESVRHIAMHCDTLLFSPVARFGLTDDYLLLRLLLLLLAPFDFVHIISEVQKRNPDVIWLSYGNRSYFLLFILRLATKKKIVSDTDSVWSRFTLRGIPYEKNFVRKVTRHASGVLKRVQEWIGVQLADVTTAVSHDEQKYYQGMTRKPERVFVFSNVIDVTSYSDRPANEVRHPSLYLAGTIGPNSPMEDAILWTFEEILPKVWEKHPALHLYLIGRGATQRIKDFRDSRITLTGGIPSVLPYLCNVDAVIVPLRFESGTRFKILEAAACRTPIISTSLGAEALDFRHGTDILIADKAADFAEAICSLIAHPELKVKLAENAYNQVNKHYSVPAASRQAKDILAYVART